MADKEKVKLSKPLFAGYVNSITPVLEDRRVDGPMAFLGQIGLVKARRCTETRGVNNTYPEIGLVGPLVGFGLQEFIYFIFSPHYLSSAIFFFLESSNIVFSWNRKSPH